MDQTTGSSVRGSRVFKTLFQKRVGLDSEERNPVGVASFLLVSPAGGPAHSYSCLASCIRAQPLAWSFSQLVW